MPLAELGVYKERLVIFLQPWTFSPLKHQTELLFCSSL